MSNMSKFRIKEDGGFFYIQERRAGFWTDVLTKYKTFEEAKAEAYKKKAEYESSRSPTTYYYI